MLDRHSCGGVRKMTECAFFASLHAALPQGLGPLGGRRAVVARPYTTPERLARNTGVHTTRRVDRGRVILGSQPSLAASRFEEVPHSRHSPSPGLMSRVTAGAYGVCNPRSSIFVCVGVFHFSVWPHLKPSWGARKSGRSVTPFVVWGGEHFAYLSARVPL